MPKYPFKEIFFCIGKAEIGIASYAISNNHRNAVHEKTDISDSECIKTMARNHLLECAGRNFNIHFYLFIEGSPIVSKYRKNFLLNTRLKQKQHVLFRENAVHRKPVEIGGNELPWEQSHVVRQCAKGGQGFDDRMVIFG